MASSRTRDIGIHHSPKTHTRLFRCLTLGTAFSLTWILLLGLSCTCFVLLILWRQDLNTRREVPTPDPLHCSLTDIADYLEGRGLRLNVIIEPGEDGLLGTILIDEHVKHLNSLDAKKRISSHEPIPGVVCVYQCTSSDEAKNRTNELGSESFAWGIFAFGGDLEFLQKVHKYLEEK